MEKNNNSEKSRVGITLGVVIGFMLGVGINAMFIPISIGVGALCDKIKNHKRDK